MDQTHEAGPSVPPDPLKEKKRKDAPSKKKKKKEKKAAPENKIMFDASEPSMGVRQHEEEERPKTKYVPPRLKSRQKTPQRNVTKPSSKGYGFVMPEVATKKKVDVKLDVPSPEVSQAKVALRRTTPSPSFLYPPPPDPDELQQRKPKGRPREREGDDAIPDYDSFDLVYTRKPRPDMQEGEGRATKRKKKRTKGEGLEDIEEADEDGVEGGRMVRGKVKKKRPEATSSSWEKEVEVVEEVTGGQQQEDAAPADNYLTRQFKRKVSQISAATSYQSGDVRTTADTDLPPEERVASSSRGVQKFRRDSEARRYEPPKRKLKRGTLESHSFTDVRQPTLKDFFFGSKEGSMHQGSDNFPEAMRNNQGVCMPVAAYCFSMLKHPTRWTAENIDEILEAGNVLMLESKKRAHKHFSVKELNHQHLQKYCVIGDKKIRFAVEEPEVFGFIRSDDRRVFNLTKGLRVFFSRQSAGILKTQEANIGMWRDKHYYMFDARPRTRDLYYSPYGTAVMANFYDVAALATVLLTRSDFGNWPFAIHPVKAFKVLGRDELEAESQAEPDVRSNFNIINEHKAVVSASFDLADKCFDFSRNKQSLAMAAVALVYSRITPPSAWQRATLDKIMIVGNQLYMECVECESVGELRVDSLPALFTIGPYMVEIYVYANVHADLMYKKCCCTLATCFEGFFEKSSNAIVQVDKCHLAVWKQRNMYYCFDPYSRDAEGFRCRDGTACVSMHTTIASLVETLAKNFDKKDAVFFVHALKVCKVQRDPVQSAGLPRHAAMDELPAEQFRRYRMRKSRKAATEKPVTVDYSALAMRKMLAGEEPQRSVFEVGSNVGSLGADQMPPMVRKHPSRSALRRAGTSRSHEVIADLDSPSLSDTQMEPPLPEQPALPEEIHFMDLENFGLTQDEMEMQEREAGHGRDQEEYGHADRLEEYGDGGGRFEEYDDGGGRWEDYGGGGGRMEAGDYGGAGAEEGGEEAVVEDEFVMMRVTQTQVSRQCSREVSKTSQQINTDITFFPIQKEILYPTRVRDRQRRKSRALPKRARDDGWEEYAVVEPQVTRSEELRKETNFKDLPDGTQIVSGSRNVAGMGRDVEYMAPFVCIMAGVVAKKYGIATWTGDVVDYVLRCGSELYGASKLRYDQVSKLEIPKVTLGNAHFAVLVEYVFDTYTKQNILELAIEKILFVRSDKGVLVTPTYACALLYKNHLYYLYDPFGNNEVGLGEGPANEGTACFVRFKDVRSLVERIMHNKSKREQEEEVVYSRFVLSSVRVKTLHPSQEETAKKRKKKTRKEAAAKKEGEREEGAEEGEGEGEGEERPKGGKEMKRSAKATDGDKDESEEEEEEEIEVTEDGKRRIKRRKAVNKVGYQNKNGLYVIEGTKQLTDRDAPSDELKQDHFVCLCACLMLLVTPIQKWDTKRVDRVLENGRHVFSHAEDLEISEKRTIKNVLIDRYFFDIVVRQLRVGRYMKSMSATLETILKRKISYFLVQLPNACYVVHKSRDGLLHLFDPYGFPGQRDGANKAGWVRFKNLRQARLALKRLTKGGRAAFACYNFEVTFIKKAPKRAYLSERLSEYDLVLAGKRERFKKPYYEDLDWIKTDAVPWSRRYSKAANGRERGKADNMWHNWDVEYVRDLFSLLGNIHQSSERFSDETRGRQTLANLVAAIGMTEIYDLSEWNSAVVDSILANGDNYYGECRKNFNDTDYEMCMDDLKEECSIFPFSFKVAKTPVVEGTMFLVRLTQFNLYKALRYFFDKYERRCGVVSSTAGERRRSVAFGKLREMEYFMFDCEAWGPPMFGERTGSAYVLRTTTLNRLLHVLTVTLRGGDFFIFEVEVNDLNPIS